MEMWRTSDRTFYFGESRQRLLRWRISTAQKHLAVIGVFHDCEGWQIAWVRADRAECRKCGKPVPDDVLNVAFMEKVRIRTQFEIEKEELNLGSQLNSKHMRQVIAKQLATPVFDALNKKPIRPQTATMAKLQRDHFHVQIKKLLDREDK